MEYREDKCPPITRVDAKGNCPQRFDTYLSDDEEFCQIRASSSNPN